jgi:hypothetical protein
MKSALAQAVFFAGLTVSVIITQAAGAEPVAESNPPGETAPSVPESARRLPGADTRPTEAEIGEFERSNFIPIRDRWRIGYTGRWYDPYNQNVLKADYPIFGQQTFFSFTGISDTLFEARNLPTPQGTSRAEPGSNGEFFGNGRQLFLNQNFIATFDLFHGSTGFRPKDWELRLTPVFNVNYLDVQENGVVNIDVRRGTTRTDGHVGLQEAFAELRLADISRTFDFLSVRAGIQGFTSDFRGFIFSDNEPGIRFFGNFDNNRYQWNVAYFNLLEKDTNSGLNTFRNRHQQVIIANLFRQDFIWLGYTAQLSFHYNLDEAGSGDTGGQHYDTNGFLVRPALVGDVRPHDLHAAYFGWTGDGHIGRVNVTHALYQVIGHDDFNSISGRPIDINAHMAAAELSYDIDWLRPKVSVFYGSGDRNPRDGTGGGFDSIIDNVNFAGSGFSFFNRQGIKFTEFGVNIVNRFSLLADLRSSKDQGQSNFVNPGTFLVNAGLDADLTPKLKALFNVNFIWFVYTEPLVLLTQQPGIRHYVGEDYSLGLIYRPFLNNNVITSIGMAYFHSGSGFRDIQVSENLYSTFLSVTLMF